MDVAVDLYLAVPLLFTVLALVLASVFVRLRGAEGERPQEPAAAEPTREGDPGGEEAAGAEPAAGPEAEGSRVPVEEVGAGEAGKEAAAEQREAAAEPGPAAEPSPAAAESIPRPPPAEPRDPGQREDAESEEEDLDLENEKLVVREPEDEDAADETFSFKYSPGKLRGNQYKSMMTKEELEEEQRVQREQLAAIFRLMKEKSDTFGEMSEGDMKEQLRLYDI
ncbi:matrix-remodeling-associated protein 7 isoform X4 [Falco peregrinus]|uniref:matrix-remodeling-associated protein 7 isoform X4 n=1 Tax=Falco peregrinus TaxID=8954 RepID=UPI00247A89A1|nr:matrix-remodeling-associated protein 7 isoform X4 [Falco peregrinus]